MKNESTINSINNNLLIKDALSIGRYIASVEKGKKVFIIYRPELPMTISSLRLNRILLLFSLLGLFIGMFIVLVKKAIKLRRNNLKN